MDPRYVVLEISSDEEVGLDDYRGDDYDWLSELLREVDKSTDDSDDVVVVREVNPKQKSKSSKSTAKDDDDDCVVLDGDPDNPVPTVDDSENGSDDLLVVGEKGQAFGNTFAFGTDCPILFYEESRFGQPSLPPLPFHMRVMAEFVLPGWYYLGCSERHCKFRLACLNYHMERGWVVKTWACFGSWLLHVTKLGGADPACKIKEIACRDYPHSRDQCAKFPFNSTTHDRHCDQCHCYVCDSLAPCGHWGTGMNIVDHCHATNKDEFWVNQRKSFRLGKSQQVPIQKHATALPQVSQNSSFPLLQPNPIWQNQVSRPTSIHACSSRTNVGVPNTASLTRNQRSEVDLGRTRFQPHLVSQKPHGTQSNIVNRKDRGHGFGPLGPQFSSSQPMFKRTGSGRGALTANRSGYGLPNNINHAYTTFSRNVPQRATPNDRTSSRWHDHLPGVALDSAKHQTTQPNMGSIFSNTVPSQPQAYGQPILQSNDCQGTYLHGNQAQNVVNPSFADISGSWPGGTSHGDQPPPIENSQLQSAEPTFIPSVMEFNPQFPVSTNPDPLDLFDSWILENQSVQGAPEGSVPNGLNLTSQDHAPAAVDAGMLYFDFETSWGSLTHA
ncbi:hypothetical protein CK203_069018 [Vitis vinifera]|uniref:Uncharacterized protein n=1 Tax=Vitis vinifera TaxID=29760 RepID=A0A438F147_VITVI|nr:hypothetical protein CK203_069018 [Vitis vinifera]